MVVCRWMSLPLSSFREALLCSASISSRPLLVYIIAAMLSSESCLYFAACSGSVSELSSMDRSPRPMRRMSIKNAVFTAPPRAGSREFAGVVGAVRAGFPFQRLPLGRGEVQAQS